MALHELEIRRSRKDFWSYCLFYDRVFFTKRKFIKRIADAFMRLYDAYNSGETYKIAISLPPRSGKSYVSSLFISWMIGHFPEESAMRNCCADKLYKKFSYDTRDIIRSAKFKEVFPDINLKADKQNVDGWNVEGAKQVTYFGGGVGSTIIGFGASMLAITDDLYSGMEDARSETINEAVWVWNQGTHESRIEKNACRIDIGTRWSKKDVLGRLEEMGIYDEIIRIPALDENGNSFCEDVKTTAQYKKIKEQTDDEIWSAEYMQEPIELKGTLFPKSELSFYNSQSFSFDKSNYTVLITDPADTGDDFTVAFAYVVNGEVYIDSMICNNNGIEHNVPATVDLIIEKEPSISRIEGNGGWIQTAKDIRTAVEEKNTSLDIFIYKETSNKEEKILSQAYFIKNRFRFRSDYEKSPEYKRAVDRLTAYQRNKKNQKDDVPDVLANLSKYLRANGVLE